MGPKPTSNANTPTKTHWIFEQLCFVDTRARSLYAEHIRALIRLCGLTIKMCVSVYSIFSVERTSRRGTPHYIGLRGYSTGGRYADAIGLGG